MLIHNIFLPASKPSGKGQVSILTVPGMPTSARIRVIWTNLSKTPLPHHFEIRFFEKTDNLSDYRLIAVTEEPGNAGSAISPVLLRSIDGFPRYAVQVSRVDVLDFIVIEDIIK